MNPAPSYYCTQVDVSEVRHLFEAFHGYKSVGSVATYAFAVIENGLYVAAYTWNPPAPGAAIAICPEAPYGVLSLSRMVALPHRQRTLNHVSKPLRYQMRRLIDRTRWPVLVTYSDASLGHTGHVYKCSGWKEVTRETRTFYVAPDGARISSYVAGRKRLLPPGDQER